MKITKQRLQQIIKEEVGRFTATEENKKNSHSQQIEEACSKLKKKVTSEELLESLLDMIPEEELLESLNFIAEMHKINLNEKEFENKPTINWKLITKTNDGFEEYESVDGNVELHVKGFISGDYALYGTGWSWQASTIEGKYVGKRGISREKKEAMASAIMASKSIQAKIKKNVSLSNESEE